MCRQTFVPLTGPGLRDGFHEVPLQLADTGMMPEKVLLRFIKLLHEGKFERKRDRTQGGNKHRADSESGVGREISGFV